MTWVGSGKRKSFGPWVSGLLAVLLVPGVMLVLAIVVIVVGDFLMWLVGG